MKNEKNIDVQFKILLDEHKKTFWKLEELEDKLSSEMFKKFIAFKDKYVKIEDINRNCPYYVYVRSVRDFDDGVELHYVSIKYNDEVNIESLWFELDCNDTLKITYNELWKYTFTEITKDEFYKQFDLILNETKVGLVEILKNDR